MSRTRSLGASNRSSSVFSSPSAVSKLFCCIFTFPADQIFKVVSRLMHRIFGAEQVVGGGMKMLCRCVDSPTDPDDRDQSIECFLIERLVSLRRGHDELKS